MLSDRAHSKQEVNRAGSALRDSLEEKAAEAELTVEWWRARHAKPLARVNANLRHYVKKVGMWESRITQRLKRFDTIVDKLRREPSMLLSRMEDIGGVRAVLDTQSQVDRIVADLQKQPKWKIRRVREYVDGCVPGPKADGYRAKHVIVEKDGCFVEIQLRTVWQDAWAQSVEQDTRRLRSGLKFGDGPADLREYYSLISDFYAMRARHEEPPQEFLERLAKMYAVTRRYFPDEEEDRAQ